MAATGDSLTVSQLAVMGLAGDSLLIPPGFWEPGTLSVHKGHFGQGATAIPFSASLVVGPSITSPLSINTIGLEQLTGIRNCFGSDIKIGSDISLGALNISYSAVFSEKNGLKDSVVPKINTVTPNFDTKALKWDVKSPAGTFTGKLDVIGGLFKNGLPVETVSVSDIRVKTNVNPLQNCLEKVLNLQGVEYDRIDIKRHEVGMIAQEVEKIVPDLVQEDSKGFKVLHYKNLTALLVEAIKEQQQQIEELKQRILVLENQ